MIRINNIKLPLEQRGQVESAVLKKLKVPRSRVKTLHIFRESIDARKRDQIFFVYTVDVSLENEQGYLHASSSADITATPDLQYVPPAGGTRTLSTRPVVVGMGPAGLFAALTLAEQGYRPIVLERGSDVDARAQDVHKFWTKGVLSPESNVQFGEGGAGAFSDGKLTTNIRDLRCRKVLQSLVSAGAPEDILYSYKPHVGTDILRPVVKVLRQRLLDHGGEVHFNTHVTDFRVQNAELSGLIANGLTHPAEVVVMALGHSARDTYASLLERGFNMVPKPFSVGARVEHLQSAIDEAQYGRFAGHPKLGAADYKLSYHSPSGRSAYTFCMCPGGVVVAAASQACGVVTNGMSYHARSLKNANSALLVGVGPEDFGHHPLDGVRFQQQLEEKAYLAGGSNYNAPAQTMGDFLRGVASTGAGNVQPTYRPGVSYTTLDHCLPAFVTEAMREAIIALDKKLRGFADTGAVLTGVETRSSAPVRIVRDDTYRSNILGLYPAGEGAGYAGGIISAAVDGIKVAEQIIAQFAPPKP